MTFIQKIIAFSGKKGSGKSTCAEIILKSSNFVRLSFAGPLKEAITMIFGFDDECYNVNKKEVIHPDWNVTPRELLQKIGTDLFRNQLKEVCPNIIMPEDSIWVSNVYYRIKKLEKEEKHVVIDDCRFEDEYNMVDKLGGIVININRDCGEDNYGEDNMSKTHASEAGCSFHKCIENNGSMSQLEDRITCLTNLYSVQVSS